MSERDALETWSELFSRFQPYTPVRRALMGNGAGTVAVDGEPGWVWVRYDEQQAKLSKVRCFLGYMEEDTPVIIGKWNPSDKYVQVLGVYWGPYVDGMSDYQYAFHKVPRHGDTHHGTFGSDPAWIDYANFVFGRVTPTEPYSLNVYIEAFVYSAATETRDFNGSLLDLSGEVPAIAGHKYVLVYFDLDTEAVAYTSSSIVPLAVPAEIPTLEDVSAIPLGVVNLYNGQTEITFDDTWQRKLMLGNIGGNVPPHIHDSDASGGASLIGIEELFLECATALPIIGNAITPTDVYHELYIQDTGLYTSYPVYGESYVATDLVWIYPDESVDCGQIVVLRPAEPGMYTDYRITVRDGIGNIRLCGGGDIVLDDRDDHIVLIYNGENWCQIGGCWGNGSVVWIGNAPAYLNIDYPINLSRVSALLASPVSGTLEFYDDRMYLTNVGTQRAIDRTSDVITETITVSNTVVETTIYSSDIPPNSLKVGNVVKGIVSGTISNASAADDITIRLKQGGNTVLTFNPAVGNVTDADWHMEGYFTIRTVGAAGTEAGHVHLSIDDDEVTESMTGAVDTTVAQDFTVTVQWDNAKPANTISLLQGLIEYKN